MFHFLKHTMLGIPLYVWILQLLYVALAVTILYVFASNHKRSQLDIILFVAGIIIVDVAWRLAIK
ncbi:MAG TPA: hypothetical protein VFN31_00520 [Candidatus Saccharimonadales bacterium]|nr:hypothetical protein [Candidatus Saccharimonadales bacterium]